MREWHRVPGGNRDVLGPATVGEVPEHLAGGAELLASGVALIARSASHQIMQADRIANTEIQDILADFSDLACDFVSEREGKRVDTRTPGSVVHVGMTNSCGANVYEYVTWTATRHRDFGIFHGVTRGEEADSAHTEA